MNDMKLIMERFEAFSEQQSTKSLVDYRPISDTAFRIIRNRVRYSARQFERYLRKKNSKYIARLNFDKSRKYLMGGAFSIDLRRAFKAGATWMATGKESAYLPIGSAGFPKATIAALERIWKQRAQKERYLTQAWAFYNDPIQVAIYAAIRQHVPKVDEPEAELDTPDRKPGDIPVTPVRKPISPTDTTQQGGASGKIARTIRILNRKFRSLTSIGIRSAADLNDKLAQAGFGQQGSEVTAQTIKAVRAFQEKYNEKNPNRTIAVDGLFGGQTARALRRYKK